MRFAATPIAEGTPYPEVTELICLVPEQTITRAPENTHLVHLCRFVVRILQLSLAAFPRIRPAGFPLPTLTSLPFEHIAQTNLLDASPHRPSSNYTSHEMYCLI